MSRFFFHVYDDEIARDSEGLELADIGQAMNEALLGARELACEQVRKGVLDLSHRVEVEDEAGAIVGIVTFRDAIAVTG